MNPRTKYTMTQADFDQLMEACKPTRVMLIGSYSPPSPQENANRAWAELGKRMGFDSMTVEPDGSDAKCFTAVPSETEPQRIEREARQAKEDRDKEIEHLRNVVEQSQKRLSDLEAK